MSEDPNKPVFGSVVHYVENQARCTTSLVNGTTHPYPGDDGQYCLSIDVFWAGSSANRRDHVPHGVERGHWHRDTECRSLHREPKVT